MTATECSTAYIGLGSNLEQPYRQIRMAFQALAQIPDTRTVAASGLYRSRPLVPPSGSIEQPDYVNAVVKIETGIGAHELLDYLQQIETAQGRKRLERWGPRTIDLDILMFDDLQVNDERLTLPHAGIGQRAFVLYPLFTIDDSLEIPGHGMLREMLKHCPDDGLQYLGTIEGYEE